MAQIDHNTKVKLTKFHIDHTKHVNYHLLLDALREWFGMKKRVVEVGPLPDLPPNFFSARGNAVPSKVSVGIPTKAPYILGTQLALLTFLNFSESLN